MSVKKIGILTFHNGPNYGGFLQAWHMKHAIESFGFIAEIINYQNSDHARDENFKLSVGSIAEIKGTIFNWIKRRPFVKVIEELCASSQLKMNADEVEWNSYDCLVVGSDVIWDYRNPRYGVDPVFFGQAAGQQDIGILAYAASCGEATLEDPRPLFVDEGLKNFSTIRVRDDNTANIVEKVTSSRPQVVCDPTWLTTDDPLCRNPKIIAGEYLLIYGPRLPHDGMIEIRKYAQQKGMKIVAAGTTSSVADHTFLALTPAQWLDLVRKAKGVVTSTLHGSHYAMKFQKPMIFFEAPNSKYKARKAFEMAGRTESWVIQGESLSANQVKSLLEPQSGVPTIPVDWVEKSRQIFEDDIRSLLGEKE